MLGNDNDNVRLLLQLTGPGRDLKASVALRRKEEENLYSGREQKGLQKQRTTQLIY